MASFLKRAFAVRTVAAALFLVAMLGLIGSTLLRERLASQSPAVRSRMILAAAVAKGFDPKRFNATAHSLALRDPLQAASFVLAGLALTRKQDTQFDLAHPLMEAAMERQPSLEAPQIWLAADYARRGDFNRSLDQFDKVLSLSDDFSALLIPALTDLLKSPQSRNAVIARLRQYPVWRTALLGQVIELGLLPDQTLTSLLADPVPPLQRKNSNMERMAFVSALVKRGEVERAHAFYRGYVGIDPRAPIYDGNFSEERPFSPFGWTMAVQPEDYSERIPRLGGGWAARLHSSGRRPATLLEQTFALAPGRWTVEFLARDAGLARPDQLLLTMACSNGDIPPLAVVALGTLGEKETTLRFNFVVSQQCPIQRLAFIAKDNDGAASEIEVTGFRVFGS
jgi:tetratricopeptide (TPR) repeat protein